MKHWLFSMKWQFYSLLDLSQMNRDVSNKRNVFVTCSRFLSFCGPIVHNESYRGEKTHNFDLTLSVFFPRALSASLPRAYQTAGCPSRSWMIILLLSFGHFVLGEQTHSQSLRDPTNLIYTLTYVLKRGTDLKEDIPWELLAFAEIARVVWEKVPKMGWDYDFAILRQLWWWWWCDWLSGIVPRQNKQENRKAASPFRNSVSSFKLPLVRAISPSWNARASSNRCYWYYKDDILWRSWVGTNKIGDTWRCEGGIYNFN